MHSNRQLSYYVPGVTVKEGSRQPWFPPDTFSTSVFHDGILLRSTWGTCHVSEIIGQNKNNTKIRLRFYFEQIQSKNKSVLFLYKNINK